MTLRHADAILDCLATDALPASRGGWVWMDRLGVLGRALAIWGVTCCAIPKELLRVLRFGFCQSASTSLLCLLMDFVPKKPCRAKPETEMPWTKPSTGTNRQQFCESN